jgi:Uma2 family endonuclease
VLNELPEVSTIMKPIRFAPSEWTYSEYARLPDDGNHYEVLDGEVLMTPAAGTRHQRVAGRIFIALHEHVEAHELGELFYDIDLLFAEGHYLRPDILFVPNSEREGITDRGMERTPGLVVEVLSPSSGTIDMVKKPRRYADFGLPEYWVADPADRRILRYDFRSGFAEPTTHTHSLEWRSEPTEAALELDVAAIFR